jgi:hypothetical protein
MQLALKTSTRIRQKQGAAAASQRQLSRYMLLNKLPGGIRTDLWLAISEQASGLDDVVLMKLFVPHQPGVALDGLRDELELAGKLAHDNIVTTRRVGFEAGCHFLVNEYLEGTTLRTLLRCVELSGVRLASAAVVRILMALVAAVDHAERVSSSVGALRLSRQPVAVEDVFITYDGTVKLLGFKSRLADDGSAPGALSGVNPGTAVDALLFGHLTPELGAVLSRASSPRIRACDRLWQLGDVLQDWQTEELGSDGRGELATVMSALPAAVRLEQRARLDAALDGALRARRPNTWPTPELGEEQPPLSGFRRTQPAPLGRTGVVSRSSANDGGS